MLRRDVSDKIIEVGMRFVNCKEVKPNTEWDKHNNEILDLMTPCGWSKGLPYCAAFCEGVWRQALTELNAPEEVIRSFTRLMNPSTLGSYEAFKKESKTEAMPIPGSIFLMRNGKTVHGHAGIVKEVDWSEKQIITIEGNTGAKSAVSDPSDREGDGIYSKKRTVSFTKSSTSLYFLGFIYPPEW